MSRRGKTKYKGMFSEGHKFGDWVLLDSDPIRVQRPGSKNKFTYKYKCRCESCGTQSEVDCYNLEKGISTRCFDCSMEDNKGSSNPAWSGYKDVPKSYYTQIKNGAKSRGIHFDVTIEDLWDAWQKQEGLCALSGMQLTLGSKGANVEKGASLDRIDSNQGYTKNNIQWLHKHINLMKRNYEQEYFIGMCKMIAENKKK